LKKAGIGKLYRLDRSHVYFLPPIKCIGNIK